MSFSKELNNDNVPPGGVTLKSDPNYVDLLDEDKPISGQKFAFRDLMLHLQYMRNHYKL